MSDCKFWQQVPVSAAESGSLQSESPRHEAGLLPSASDDVPRASTLPASALAIDENLPPPAVPRVTRASAAAAACSMS